MMSPRWPASQSVPNEIVIGAVLDAAGTSLAPGAQAATMIAGARLTPVPTTALRDKPFGRFMV